VLLSVGVLPVVGSENHASTILDNGFAGHKNRESSLVSFVDAKLMTVKFEGAINAIFDKDSRPSNCCFYIASSQSLKEQDF
jgi:hypothetical protein